MSSTQLDATCTPIRTVAAERRRLLQILLTRDVKRGRQSEEHRRQEADRDGERHHAPVGRGIEPRRRVGPDHDALEHERAERKASDAPHQGQDETLREQLADEPAGSRADGAAQRHLALTRRAAGQQQAAQISARHREDQQDQNSDDREHRHRADELRAAAGFAQQGARPPRCPWDVAAEVRRRAS